MKTLRIAIDNHRKEFQVKNGKRILLATMAADGHFNPMTGIAKILTEEGYDVRWYTQEMYQKRIEKIGVKFYPFVHAPQINQFNFEELYPERKKIKSVIAKIKFDFKHAYLQTAYDYYKDILEIHRVFPFDLLIADIMFSGTPYVKDKLNVPVIAIGVMPVMETSESLAPAGLGLLPAETPIGRWWQHLLRKLADKLVYAPLNRLCKENFSRHGIARVPGNIIDMLYRKPDIVLQSGCPSFEYQRKDLHPDIHFAGPLYPECNGQKDMFQFGELRKRFKKVVLVTQGTIEKDPEKIIVPVLEAYKNTDYLVVATTGGSCTTSLRERFPFQNIIIEDFIPFPSIMPFADVYVSNGGYGGVLMSIKNKLPMVVAGIHEGKNEICARVGHFKIGMNLKTERPSVNQMKHAIENVLNDGGYRKKIAVIAKDASNYDTRSIVMNQVRKLIARPLYFTPMHNTEKTDRLKYIA
jgi:UDP:flavonoid glycosyltransferase YjiC (YdhE family)